MPQNLIKITPDVQTQTKYQRENKFLIRNIYKLLKFLLKKDFSIVFLSVGKSAFPTMTAPSFSYCGCCKSLFLNSFSSCPHTPLILGEIHRRNPFPPVETLKLEQFVNLVAKFCINFVVFHYRSLFVLLFPHSILIPIVVFRQIASAEITCWAAGKW